MKTEKPKIADSVEAVLGKLTSRSLSRRPRDRARVVGHVHAVLTGPDGKVKGEWSGRNLVTDYGDEFLATRSYDNAVDEITGMKLGTGSTAAAKNGAGATLVTYISGSQQVLDGTPTDASLGAGAGHRVSHVTTWIAGDVTNSAIREVVLTNQTALADNSGSAGVTVARFVFASAIDKQAGDSLAVTWHIDILGA